MKRQLKGIIGWSILSLLFGVITLFAMIAREEYQFKSNPYQKRFEWEDVFTYGLFILIFGLFHWCVLDICFKNCPTILFW